MVDYIIICLKMFYGKSTKDFRELAFGISQINDKVVPESWKIYNKAGVDWMQVKSAYDRSELFSDGTRIYNLDETATTTVQKPKKVLASKSSKQVSQSTIGERGTLVTTCCIVSASGNTLPLAMGFPRKKALSGLLALTVG